MWKTCFGVCARTQPASRVPQLFLTDVSSLSDTVFAAGQTAHSSRAGIKLCQHCKGFPDSSSSFSHKNLTIFCHRPFSRSHTPSGELAFIPRLRCFTRARGCIAVITRLQRADFPRRPRIRLDSASLRFSLFGR